jgi:hypothetical protein
MEPVTKKMKAGEDEKKDKDKDTGKDSSEDKDHDKEKDKDKDEDKDYSKKNYFLLPQTAEAFCTLSEEELQVAIARAKAHSAFGQYLTWLEGELQVHPGDPDWPEFGHPDGDPAADLESWSEFLADFSERGDAWGAM